MSLAEVATSFTRLPAEIEALLVCPRCKSRLEVEPDSCHCTGAGCNTSFPVSDGVPVLFNEEASLFSIDGVLVRRDKPFTAPVSALRQKLSSLAPTLSRNLSGTANYRLLAQNVCKLSTAPKVLVIGSRVLGTGMEVLADYPNIELIESDVELGDRPAVLFDAHDIPFDDGAFDGVVAQAVLEHVADPQRCVSELRRVLKPRGILYAETPFMQQVHEGPYDYTRFTHLGHRRLFRDFEEIESGIACGPGMALAWSWQYFLMSFARTNGGRTCAKAAARSTAFFFKYFDRYLARHPAAFDAASGFYFVGRRSESQLTDRQLPPLYRGAIRS